MRRFAIEITRLMEQALGDLRLPAAQIADQIPGAQVAPAASGSPGVVDLDSVEPALGDPGTSGFVLSSTTAGVRSWVAQSGGMANPMTAQDDLIVGDLVGAPARLAKGGDGQVLTVDPATHHLIWTTPATPVTAVSGTAPITSSGGTTPAISISAATAGAAGSMSASDKSKLDGVAAAADPTGATIHAAAGKATPADADELGLIDSAASNALKKLTWANLKAALKTYLDTLYAAITHKSRHATGGADALSPADIGAATTSAASLTSGTLADARLSSNVPLRSAANDWTAKQTIEPDGSGDFLTINASTYPLTVHTLSGGVDFRGAYLRLGYVTGTNTVAGALLQMFGNAVTGAEGQFYFDAGTHANSAIFFRTNGGAITAMKIDLAGNVILTNVPRNPSAGTISGYATGTIYADASNVLKVK